MQFETNKVMFRGVYYVESENPHINPIAIRPEVSPHSVAWEDTSNGRVVKCSRVLLDGEPMESKIAINSSIPEKIEFIGVDPKSERYKFVKLTNKIFDEKIRYEVAGGESLNFKTDQELQDYYLKTNFMGY